MPIPKCALTVSYIHNIYCISISIDWHQIMRVHFLVSALFLRFSYFRCRLCVCVWCLLGFQFFVNCYLLFCVQFIVYIFWKHWSSVLFFHPFMWFFDGAELKWRYCIWVRWQLSVNICRRLFVCPMKMTHRLSHFGHIIFYVCSEHCRHIINVSLLQKRSVQILEFQRKKNALKNTIKNIVDLFVNKAP